MNKTLKQTLIASVPATFAAICLALPVALNAAPGGNPPIAQSAGVGPHPVPNPNSGRSAYQEVSRGPHSRVMQRVTTSTNSAGRIQSKIHSYTELATGMSVLQHGKWVPAGEEIEITADGAQANHGQHKVHFAANLNTPGAIDLLTPEGHHMTSEPVCLAYFDGTTNVMIAELQDSIGQVLPSLKEALYTNAFSGVQADVVYHYTKASFEQDIVLREQLPDPSAFGLNPDHVWLQVWTEFGAAPVPKIARHQTDGDHLDFGIMKMGSGKAFNLGGESNSVPVYKQWSSTQGRTFLIESVPLNAIAAQLQRLPAGSSPSGNPNSAPSSGSSPGGDQSKVLSHHPLLAFRNPPHQAFDNVVLPAPKPAKKSSATMHLASSTPEPSGFVLDYSTENGSLTNFTFQSDETYYVSDNLYLYGTTTLEGGTVIKNGQPIGAATFVYDNFVCQTAPYRPAILTCTNDDTVGQQISGSTGIPAVVPGNLHLYLMDSGTISNAFFKYAWNGFGSQAPDVEI
ncbi:MAG TPA: hypothetical protein VFC07_03895, partial [Verrucomicrobiae bacterium]|nr:hypothetical protein [Verrucomicrobiae bacterium]